jgi:hypothetical protein
VGLQEGLEATIAWFAETQATAEPWHGIGRPTPSRTEARLIQAAE